MIIPKEQDYERKRINETQAHNNHRAVFREEPRDKINSPKFKITLCYNESIMRGNFSILNFFDDRLVIDALRVDFTQKKIEPLHKKELKSDAMRELRRIMAGLFYFMPYKVILSLDSRKAVTKFETITLLRDHPEKTIDDADLENLISQAIWKVLEEGRRHSAKQLSLSELDIVLFDSKIYKFEIDREPVINPLRHRGERVDIYLSQSFISRPFLREISAILPKRANLVFAVEAGVAASHLLSKVDTENNFIFAKVMDETTELFFVNRRDNGKISFRDYFRWGKKQFFSALGDDLHLSASAVESVMKKFAGNQISDIFSRRLREIISREIAVLQRGLRHALLETKSDLVYLDFPPLTTRFRWKPPKGGHTAGESGIGLREFISRRNTSKSESPYFVHASLEDNQLAVEKGFSEATTGLIPLGIFSKIVKEVNTSEIAHFFGFDGGVGEYDLLTLGTLLGFYFLPGENFLNHLAKRRMKWLMP